MRQDERFNASRKLEKRVRESENQRERERKNEWMDSKHDNEHVFAFGIERKHF